jgi:FkbM family methyltransferase
MNFNLIKKFSTPLGEICYFKNDTPFVNFTTEYNKIYEQDLIFTYIKNIIKKSKIILDIGAHVGGHTLIFKKINPALEIHAFEPQSKIFELLSYNIKINNLENINLYPYAVANIKLKTTLSNISKDNEYSLPLSYSGQEEYANFGGVQLGENGEEIQTITIDSLNLSSCDFMKIDVEGAEHLVILGAIETIKKHKPYIWFEHNYQKLSDITNSKFEISTTNIFKLLDSLGYEDNILKLDKDNYLAVP